MRRYLDIIPAVARYSPRQEQISTPLDSTEGVSIDGSNLAKKPAWFSHKLLLASGSIFSVAIIAAFMLVGKPSLPVKVAPFSNTVLAQASQVPEDAPAVVPAISTPWRLQIPDINVDAGIKEVDVTTSGNMSVPPDPNDVGWFKHGSRPGQKGTAVIAGHYNAKGDKPAVFWNLKKMKLGEYIYVANGKNPRLRFKVVGMQNYDIANAPLVKIFSAAEGNHLNLITCSGKWNQAAKDYSQRLVVYTELVP